MSVSNALPIEVLEAIIDQISGYAESLRQLSLTCKVFLPRSRYHLFSRIDIRNLHQMEGSGDFFDSHPWVVNLVQQVTLSVVVGDDASTLLNPNIRVLDIVPVHLFSKLPNLCAWRMKTVPRMPTQVSLSLHRHALSCYKRHSARIKALELEFISFDDISDFVGLVSAFKGLENLTCESLRFRTLRAFQAKSDTLQVRSRALKRLRVYGNVDVRAVEYLLAACGDTLENLVLTLSAESDNLDRLQKAANQKSLSQMSSLTLVVPHCSALVAERHSLDRSVCQAIRCATSILGHIKTGRLRDVRIIFEVSPIGRLGFCLSPAGTSWKECKALEGALLVFPHAHILLKESSKKCRAGRVEFWAPIIKRAFPRLDERGVLTFPTSKADALDNPGHELPVQCICASYDNQHVVTASGDGTIIVWDQERGTIAQEWLPHGGHGVLALALSPYSPRLISASGGGIERLVVWEFGLDGTRKVATLEARGHKETVLACAWSPDGTLISSASGDGSVRVWDALTFEERALLDDPQAVSDPRYLQFSPDSRCLTWISKSPTNDYTCVLWRPLEEDHPTRFLSNSALPAVPVNALAFDPHSMCLATAYGSQGSRKQEECVVRIWDVATGTVLSVLTGHARQVNDVAFSPRTGSLVLSASSDGTVRLWDAASGIQTVALEITPGTRVLKACISPDGEYIATASTNLKRGPVVIWRIRDGACTGVLTGHRLRVLHMAFSPNGEFLTTGDVQGVVRIHRTADFISD